MYLGHIVKMCDYFHTSCIMRTLEVLADLPTQSVYNTESQHAHITHQHTHITYTQPDRHLEIASSPD